MAEDKDDSDLDTELEAAAPSKRLSVAEWEQVKTMWEMGTATLAELSRNFGVRADTIQKRLKAEGIQKGARAGEVGAAVGEEIANQAVVNTRRINQTKEDHYSYAEALAKMTMNEIISARRDRKPLAQVDANIAALNKAAKTLQILRSERYALLGLDKEDGDPDDIPELLISELTPEHIIEIQARLRAEGSQNDELEGLDDLGDEDFGDDQ